MLKKLIILALVTHSLALIKIKTTIDLCAVCQFIYDNAVRVNPNETYADIEHRIMNKYSSVYDPNEYLIFKDMLHENKKKLVDDANDKTQKISGIRSCADLGLCDPKYTTPPPFNFVDVTGTNPNAALIDSRAKTIIVLHHTVEPTVQATLDILNARGLSVQWVVDKNGTIYELIEDWNRAWHAGNGHWSGDGCLSTDINTRSIGIEIVNTGDQIYPQVQLEAVTQLVGFLMKKWHIDPWNIIAHADLTPVHKEDISGYWNWKWMYNSLGVFPGLFDSQLTPTQQKEIILNNTFSPNMILRVMQQKMIDFGYSDIVVGDPYSLDENSPNYSRSMSLHVEAFNRHYCPEIFIDEKMNSTTSLTIRNVLNTQFYALTNERLDYLLRNVLSVSAPTVCANPSD